MKSVHAPGQTDRIRVSGRTFFLSVLLVVFNVCPNGRGAEPITVAGIVEQASPAGGQFATHFLRDEGNGGVLAGLRDSRLLLPVLLPARVILQTSSTGRRDVNGLLLLDVEGVLPAHWAQPASWGFFAKGPGAYSGFGRDAQRKDFAGVPFDELRTYERDNGLDGAASSATVTSPHAPPPLRVREVQITRAGVTIHWDAVGGIKYQLLTSQTPEGPYRIVNEIAPAEDGDQSFDVPLGGMLGFFRIGASEL